mgnify:CR=1 FL=1
MEHFIDYITGTGVLIIFGISSITMTYHIVVKDNSDGISWITVALWLIGDLLVITRNIFINHDYYLVAYELINLVGNILVVRHKLRTMKKRKEL